MCVRGACVTAGYLMRDHMVEDPEPNPNPNPNPHPHPHQVYEADGLRLRAATSGERGSGDGQLCDPGGLAVLGDELLVADVSNHRLACFGLGCSYRRAIGRRGTVPAAGWQKSSLLLPPIPWWCHGSAAPGLLGRTIPGSRIAG